MKKNKVCIVLGIPLTFTIVSGLILSSFSVSASDSVVDEINITVPVSCTLSGTGMNTHTAEIGNGLYRADIGSTTLKAFCNDNNGFAIYAAGYTGNEIGGEDSNKLVGTTNNNNNNNNSNSIVTGLATSGNTSNWSMKLTLGTDSGDTSGTNALTIDSAPNVANPSQAEPSAIASPFSSYHVVPNEYVKVAHKNSATDMNESTGGATLTSTYAVYISPTEKAGTYTGQVIYTLVHPASANAPVVCNPNGTTIGTNTSTDIICMQDFATFSSSNKTTLLNSMNEGTQYTLVDKRDGKSYTIAKLADDKVWMTQNLDLDLDAGTTYTNLDTDLGWNANTSTYDTASWSPERSTYATGTTTWGLYNETTGNHDGYYHPESYDPGDLYWNGTLSDWIDWVAYYNSCTYDDTTWLYSDCDESLNPIATYTTVSGTPTQQYHLGNFYNWSAAIASNDSSSYGAYDEGTDSYINTETNRSICPAGWTLSYINYNTTTWEPEGDFTNLWTEYGWTNNDGFSDISTVWSAPLYFAPSGYFYGYPGDVGNYGYFWSSVADDNDAAMGAYFNTDGDAYPADRYFGRYGGYSVRCILR